MPDLQTLLNKFLNSLYAGIVDIGGAADALLTRVAADTIAQVRGANPQTFQVYGTTTGSKYAALAHDGTHAQLSSSSGNLQLVGASNVTLSPGNLNTFVNGNLLLQTATGVLGYAAGAGGTVTQATSKSTGVTLNAANGAVTLNAASLAANTAVSFTLTDSAVAAVDHLVLGITGGTAGAYMVTYSCGAGSAVITVRNLTAGALAEAIVIDFAVIKGAVS